MQKAKTYENEIHNKDRIIFYDNFIIPRLPPPVKKCKLLKYMNKIKKSRKCEIYKTWCTKVDELLNSIVTNTTAINEKY